MKQLYTLLFLALVSFTASAQQPPLPNGDFENWVMVNSQLDPTGYYTTDSLTGITDGEVITRSTDAHGGQYSAKLSAIVGTVSLSAEMLSGSSDYTGIPFDGQPQTLRGWFKPELGSTLAAMTMVLYANGMQVGSASHTFQGTSDWTFFQEPVVYDDTLTQPTHLYLNFTLQGSEAVSLYLDDFDFTYQPTGISETRAPAFHLYPNPTSSSPVIVTGSTKAFAFDVIDATGRVVSRGSMVDGHGVVERPATGLYTVAVKDRDGNVLQRSKLVSQ